MHGTQVINSLLDIFSSAADTISICGNSRFPSQLLSLEIIKKTIAAKNSRIKQRYLVEVAKDNISYCRNLMDIVVTQNDNFRHSDEVEANSVVSEREYLGSITLKGPHQHAISKKHKKNMLTLQSPLTGRLYYYLLIVKLW